MALATSNWTIAYLNGDRNTDTVITRRKKLINLKLSMASGQWPSTGVAMPSAGSVGMVRNLDSYIIHAVKSPTVSVALNWVLTTGLVLRPFKTRNASGSGTSMLSATQTMAAQTFIVTAVGW